MAGKRIVEGAANRQGYVATVDGMRLPGPISVKSRWPNPSWIRRNPTSVGISNPQWMYRQIRVITRMRLYAKRQRTYSSSDLNRFLVRHQDNIDGVLNWIGRYNAMLRILTVRQANITIDSSAGYRTHNGCHPEQP